MANACVSITDTGEDMWNCNFETKPDLFSINRANVCSLLQRRVTKRGNSNLQRKAFLLLLLSTQMFIGLWYMWNDKIHFICLWNAINRPTPPNTKKEFYTKTSHLLLVANSNAIKWDDAFMNTTFLDPFVQSKKTDRC